MMRPAIDNPASYEIRVVIRSLRTKDMSAAEIRNELGAAVYHQYVLREGMQDNDAECSKIGEQVVTINVKAVDHL
jgi:hypothetical protein